MRELGLRAWRRPPLVFLDDANAPHCQKNNGFSDLGNYAAWPKVAGAVIQTIRITHSSGTPEPSLRRGATRRPDPLFLPFLVRGRGALLFFLIFGHERISGVFTR